MHVLNDGIERSQHLYGGAEITWLRTQDEDGLGLLTCGCGAELVSRVMRWAAPQVLLAEFEHPADGSVAKCLMAFEQRSDKWVPLKWEEYLARVHPEHDDAA
jgi:hypothetical protein